MVIIMFEASNVTEAAHVMRQVTDSIARGVRADGIWDVKGQRIGEFSFGTGDTAPTLDQAKEIIEAVRNG